MLFYFSLFHLTQCIKLYLSKGHLWSKADSHYYMTEFDLGLDDSKRFVVNTKLVRLIFYRYLCSLFSQIGIIFAFRTAILSRVNTSILFSLFSATSIFAAIVFYIVYGEKLKKTHIVGIGFMIMSVVFIANAQDNTI